VRTHDVYRRWRLYTSGITRLLNEEHQCFDDFEAASRAHSR
jgi:hypothetical protein